METYSMLRFLKPKDILGLVAKYDTPFIIYDQKSIVKNINYLQTLKINDKTPIIRYSLKANTNSAIVFLLNNLNVKFDASSSYEALRAIKSGADASKILLTSQEIDENVYELIVQGVEFDACSLSQLKWYGKHFPNTDVTIRINPGLGSGLVNRLNTGGNKSSFGIWYEYIEDVINIVEKYNLNVKRIHQHTGSGHNPKIWLKTCELLLNISKHFPTAETINFGGGYRVLGGGVSRDGMDNEEKYDYQDIFIQLGQIINKYKHVLHFNIEIEPGTFIMANAGTLISKVIDIVDTGENGYTFLKLNTGINDLARPGFYGAIHPMVVISDNNSDNKRLKKYLVVGHCCIAGDTFTPYPGDVENTQEQYLQEANIGDYIAIERAGAYCSSMNMKNFNSFPEIAEYMILKNGVIKQIKYKQSIEDILHMQIIPEELKLGEL